uniref:LLM class flavin-dependent oxidoreductase n=1 Tax=Phenylobacterium glaciei TaxID=2803784 RepID=A0A974SAF6_9CAUL|nr:LLM class flavin-dependent oxidoreductase [Phenylobacterium glaciei]
MMLADRINQLDHMTRGRVMFGAGPGALSSDAFMMGIPVAKQRDRMDEALDVLVRLLRGEEVSHESDWFSLVNARLQMTPYSRPSVEIAVASQVSPTGARAAGKHGWACCPWAPPPPPASTRWPPTGASPRTWRSSTARPWTATPGGSWARCTSPRPRTRPSNRSASAWRSGSITSARSPTCRWCPTTSPAIPWRPIWPSALPWWARPTRPSPASSS